MFIIADRSPFSYQAKITITVLIKAKNVLRGWGFVQVFCLGGGVFLQNLSRSGQGFDHVKKVP